MHIPLCWVTDTPWIFTDDDDEEEEDDIQCLLSEDVDVWGLCVHRVLFFCLEIKFLSIPAMRRAQENSFLK